MRMSLTNAFIFVSGAVIGSIATWIVMDKKCRLLEEDIEASRELYLADKYDKEKTTVAENRKSEDKPDINEYINKVKDLGYSKDEESKEEERPYLIEPGEFGTIDGYDECALTYWADEILSDDEDDKSITDDIDDIIGVEALDMFGAHEEGIIHVRNDRLKTDFEVSKDTRKYVDVIGIEMED